MIFNITSGGIAYIRVEAPDGATVTATQGGMSFSRAGSGDITVTSIGDWDVDCTYGGVQATTEHTSLSAFGATSQTVSFMSSYTATIRVTTQPGATCSAKLGTLTIPGKVANSNGICDLTVPAGGLGTWEVTADNGVYTGDLKKKSGYVDSYGSTKSISILTEIPVIVITSGSSSWTYKGASIDNSVVKIIPNGSGWKAWLKSSCTVYFQYLNNTLGIWAIGKGGNGGAKFNNSGGAYGGGGGGGGGKVVSGSYQAASARGGTYSVTVNSTGSYFGSLISATNGGNGGSPSGGSTGGGSGDGSSGEWVNDHTWPNATSGGGGDGYNGVYAFSDSSFDGVIYGHGGGGGHHSGGPGASYSAPGSGGAGAGGSYGYATNGIVGIICMKGT